MEMGSDLIWEKQDIFPNCVWGPYKICFHLKTKHNICESQVIYNSLNILFRCDPCGNEMRLV